jgi:hypothetical protein
MLGTEESNVQARYVPCNTEFLPLIILVVYELEVGNR